MGKNKNELRQISEKFYRIFGRRFTPPILDAFMLLNFGEVCVNMVALEEWLRRKFPGDCRDGVSMADIVEQKFGKDAVDFLWNLA